MTHINFRIAAHANFRKRHFSVQLTNRSYCFYYYTAWTHTHVRTHVSAWPWTF